MKLCDIFRDEFETAIIGRGEQYFETGKILNHRGNIEKCQASVSGTNIHAVQLVHDREENALEYQCDCAFEGPCKHVWAMLCLVDSAGYLAKVSDKTYLDQAYDLPSFEPQKKAVQRAATASPTAPPTSRPVQVEKKVVPENTLSQFFLPHYYYAASPQEQEALVALVQGDLNKTSIAQGLVKIIREIPETNLANHINEVFSLNQLDFDETDYDPAVDLFLRKVDAMKSSGGFADAATFFASAQEVQWAILVPDAQCPVHLDVHVRAMAVKKKKNGEWGKASESHKLLMASRDRYDRQIIDLLGLKETDSTSNSSWMVSDFRLQQAMPALIASGRCQIIKDDRLQRDEIKLDSQSEADKSRGDYCVTVSLDEGTDKYLIGQVISRGYRQYPLSTLDLFTSRGYIHQGIWYQCDFSAYEQHIELYSHHSLPLLDEAAAKEFTRRFRQDAKAPQLICDGNLESLAEAKVNQKELVFEQLQGGNENTTCEATAFFHYDETLFSVWDDRPGNTQIDGVYLPRDKAYEEQALQELRQVGVEYQASEMRLIVKMKILYESINKLSELGWKISVDGKRVRQQSASSFKLKTNIDWLDLAGEVEFGDQKIVLSELLVQLKKRKDVIELADGSLGLFSSDDFDRLQHLLAIGKKHEDGFRFQKSQSLLLEAMLSERDDVVFDAQFTEARAVLEGFDGVEAMAAPPSLQGELREYQEQGLGWLNFCQKFGLGGCLADDMGLGKTIQVLAMLEMRRLDETVLKPSLVVVPTSLVFNWLAEVEKFTPQIKVLDHGGLNRAKNSKTFADYDIVLVTYGTLRNDIEFIKDVSFDYAILDEGQAIKNPGTANAKAARLILADHRLVMSGTPIENHIGELWSLFEFLNPGMLGSANAFKNFNANLDEPEILAALANSFKPLILRRHKEEVAKELPEKIEQTLFYEMSDTQKTLYNSLKASYQQNLLTEPEQTKGGNKLKILEALVRLRQAACHPALVDSDLYGPKESSKLDLVVPQLLELIAEGRKVLVFSQFTSFLALLKLALDEQDVNYEYLDGKTRNRQEKVEHFQTDKDCRLFLISLKAGGTGLNLTEAEYVFLLDPWWNPAVEAQAIDRAHRIGQIRQVFAYRVIAKDTVEEKILKLQAKKKSLTDAIINQDSNGLRSLTREDLEVLFS